MGSGPGGRGVTWWWADVPGFPSQPDEYSGYCWRGHPGSARLCRVCGREATVGRAASTGAVTSTDVHGNIVTTPWESSLPWATNMAAI